MRSFTVQIYKGQRPSECKQGRMHEKQGGDQEMTERATSNKEIWEHLWESSSLHFSSYASFFFAFLACFIFPAIICPTTMKQSVVPIAFAMMSTMSGLSVNTKVISRRVPITA
mmetsp:Transcript_32738/g.84554  ORF Transcript_32738/g.84554 Transcript_32738/m.84554 type:complete len:113 (+) Transcript_32738:43-381(+)